MSISESSHPDLDALAQRLGSMPLAPAAVARDQLFFRAGQAHGSAQRRRRFVLAATLLTCVSLGAGVFMGRWTGPGPQIVEKLVLVKPGPQPEPKQNNPPALDKASPNQAIPTGNEAPSETLARALWLHKGQAKSLDALLSERGLPEPMPPSFPHKTESVEDMLDLSPGSLGETERSRWSAALFLEGKS